MQVDDIYTLAPVLQKEVLAAVKITHDLKNLREETWYYSSSLSVHIPSASINQLLSIHAFLSITKVPILNKDDWYRLVTRYLKLKTNL